MSSRRIRIVHKAKLLTCNAAILLYCPLRYDITSVACSRLILSLRNHAHKQKKTSNGTKCSFAIDPSHVGSGVVRLHTITNRRESDEKTAAKAPTPYFETGIQADPQARVVDEESRAGFSVDQSVPLQGVSVLMETKVSVDISPESDEK